MPFSPLPGTIAHSVIQHLSQQPPGTELSTAALAEAIGHDNTVPLHTYLAAAVETGALHSEKRAPQIGGPKTLYWRLGDGIPRPKAPKHSAVERDPQPEIEVQVEPKQPEGKKHEFAVFGYFSDGRVSINHHGKHIELDQQNTFELVKFIRRVFG